MKLCIGQINTTPGDFEGNFARIRRGIETASDARCDLIVFPELCVPGYLSQDLIYNPEFVDRNLRVVDEIRVLSGQCHDDLHIVIGYIGRNEGVGKPFTNMAGVIRGGEIVAEYQKQLLPFYDVFDELRYFEAGAETSVVDIAGHSVGLAICEDLWNDKGTDDYNYSGNPMAQYREQGVDVVVSLNSSPYVQGKCEDRRKFIAPASLEGPAIVYVNQVGGQDELVFDGQSFVAVGGEVRYLSHEVSEDTFDIFSLDQLTAPVKVAPVPLRELLVLGLRDYIRKSGFSEVVLASSGGVDSAVVCSLACEAIGAEHVHAIRLPSVFSSEHSRDDAASLHKNLGCWDYEVPIEHLSLVQRLNDHYSVNDDAANLVTRRLKEGGYSSLADENIQARLRDVYVMHFSNGFGAMPMSTGNKTEAGCGYYTHFDMNFSYAPIKDLYKFEVMNLAREDSAVPANIWQKPPSAELAHGQTDEESLLPYAVLDPIVMSYVEDYVTSFERFQQWLSEPHRRTQISGDRDALDAWMKGTHAEADYARIVSLIGKMEYKRRQTCPGTKVSRVAFGIGRRIPIVEKWS